MDFRVGDPFVTIQPAFNPDNPSEILYPTGTHVIVDKITDSEIVFQYPDGYLVPISKRYAYQVAHPATDVPTHFRTSTGLGTPPIHKSIMEFLPKEMDWRKNYRWTLTIEVEERGDKTNVCPVCVSDITSEAEQSDDGKLYCKTCKNFVFAIDPQTFDLSRYASFDLEKFNDDTDNEIPECS